MNEPTEVRPNANLPIIQDDPRRWRRLGLHLTRVSLLVAIVVLIHVQHTRLRARQSVQPFTELDIARLDEFYPDVADVSASHDTPGRLDVVTSTGESLGYALQTSPTSDHLVGFSGPTNMLIAFDPDDRILGIAVLTSGDTREHISQVQADEAFMTSFDGLSWEEAAARTEVDAVSGATLTSLAIQESIIYRLSGARPSLRFPDPPTISHARSVFAETTSVEQDRTFPALWHAQDEAGTPLGSLLRTSPAADNIIGYQGPTEAFVAFNADGRVVGIVLGRTYDNEEYVTYVREDSYFLTIFNDLQLDSLATLNLEEAQVEGVSGATMTNMTVAEGIVASAARHREAIDTANAYAAGSRSSWSTREYFTAAVILFGLIVALTPLRGSRRVRVCLQLTLIGYLGFTSGEMVSLAMLVGWARSGIPWSTAGGLVMLTLAAFVVPLTTRRNAYCTHLCAHGAAQHLLKGRVPWRARLPQWLQRVLKLLPGLLLAWCVVVTMTAWPFSLVDIEPFDAWVFRVAGWATISIALVGLVASLFVPMAYCRYGCPTGALLSFLRYNARSDRWSRQDSFAVLLVGLAAGLMLAS